MTPPYREELAQFLRSVNAFQNLSETQTLRLASHCEEREILSGEDLIREGDPAESLFVVLSGTVRVLSHDLGSTIRQLGRGSVVGELSLLLGGSRTATVRALEPTRVVEIHRTRFEEMTQGHPEILAAFSPMVVSRAHRSQVAGYLRDLFGDLEPAALETIENEVTWIHLAAGKELFRQGAPAEGAYIIAVGRVRIAASDGLTERPIAEVGAGEWIGEIALLTRERRSTTVYAVRDTELVFLPQRIFDDLIDQYPRGMAEIARRLGLRVVERTANQPLAANRRAFAIVPAAPGVDVRAFAIDLVSALCGFGSVSHLTSNGVDETLRHKGISCAKADEPHHLVLLPWLLDKERAHRFVVYEGDPGWSGWTDRAFRNADHVLVVADARKWPKDPPGPELTSRLLAGRGPKRTLVLLQERSRQVFAGTANWLQALPTDDHLHVRIGSSKDVARVARILTGNAICLVLGGGASRGYAHIGALRALEELGIPIDAVGGTSMGAAVAAATALGMSSSKALTACAEVTRRVFDTTLPLVSLISGKRNMDGLRRVVGDLNIEDLFTTFFCVSTNLSRAEEVIHRRGSLAFGVRASSAVPGLFPPVALNGDLLVDGGLTNNVPTDTMASLMEGIVLAVDVIPEVDVRVEGNLPMHLSGWEVAWRRLNPLAESIGVPSIARILLRSATVMSEGLRRAGKSEKEAALYLRPALSQWNMLDFTSAGITAEEGYAGTIGPLRAWWEQHGDRVMGRRTSMPLDETTIRSLAQSRTQFGRGSSRQLVPK